MTREEAILTSLYPDAMVETPEGMARLKDVVDDSAWVRPDTDPKRLKYFKLSDLTPLYYRLEDMTEEDEKEFSKEFEYAGDKLALRFDDNPFNRAILIEMLYGDDHRWSDRITNQDEIIWLMSRGYYCGQAKEWKERKR